MVTGTAADLNHQALRRSGARARAAGTRAGVPWIAGGALRILRAMKPFLTAVSILIVFAGLVAFFVVFRDAPRTPLRIAGAAIAVVSFILWAVARVNLGQSFSVGPQAHALVTRGLYRRFRHPVYLFGTLGIFGLILASGRLGMLWLVAVIVLLQWVRTRREDRVLEQAFGDAYREYRRQTWI